MDSGDIYFLDTKGENKITTQENGSKTKRSRVKYEKPYFLDKTLARRVKEYMDTHARVNIDYMTDHLIENVKEFKCKKKKFFKNSVAKAYQWEYQQRQNDLIFDKEELILDKDDTDDDLLMSSIIEDDDIVELPLCTPNKLAKHVKSDIGAFCIDAALYKNTPKTEKSLNESINNSTPLPSIDSASRKAKSERAAIANIQDYSIDASESTKKKRVKTTLSYSSVIKKKKLYHYEFSVPTITLDDVLCHEVFMDKLLHLSKNFDASMAEDGPPKNLLVMGPEGSGKSFLVQAFAGREKLPLLSVSVRDFVLDEEALDKVFAEATSNAPCFLHLTDLQVIAPKDTSHSKSSDARLNTNIANRISNVSKRMLQEQILIVGEYQYHPSQTIDWSLRSCFESEIFIPAPTRDQRLLLLKKICADLNTEVDLECISKKTMSFLPGDILKVVNKATEMSMDRHYHQFKDNLTSQNDYITKCRENFIPKSKILVMEEDFTVALKKLVPVLKRNGFPSIPEIRMNDIGGMEDVKAQIYDNILLPLENSKYSDELGIDDSSDMLLWGPPGCGKTLLAKAVANQAGINFLLISGAEVLKMYQGESERTVREAFGLAKSVSPCVIYFDEFEGICPTRSAGAESGSKSTIVTTLLSEMNGVLNREGVYVMASTNRPDVIDPALLRPGRIGTKIYVGLPDQLGRKAIFSATSKNGTRPKFASDVDFDVLSSQCANYSGADCAQLIKSASRCALKRMIKTGVTEAVVQNEDLDEAFTTIKPSVTQQALRKYEKLKEEFSSSIKNTNLKSSCY